GTPTVLSPAKVSNGLRFNGLDSWLRVPPPASGLNPLNFDNGSLTIDTWIRTTSNAVNNVFVRKRTTTGTTQGYEMRLTNGQLTLQLGDGTHVYTYGPIGPALNDSQWHLVAATVNRSTSLVTLYVDNLPPYTFPISTLNSLTNGANLLIGRGDIN